MKIAIIFAGGVGSRMKLATPKQFLLINEKPVIVHTIEKFQSNKQIDKIIVVTLKEYIDKVYSFIKQYSLSKVINVIPGGQTAMESQYLGIKTARTISSDNALILLHDGVRPFVDDETINKCIDETLIHGNAITISPAIETIGFVENEQIVAFKPREKCILARAPQCFYIEDLIKYHEKRIANNEEYVDSASMMLANNIKLNYVEGPAENIKITTSMDYTLSKALLKDNK